MGAASLKTAADFESSMSTVDGQNVNTMDKLSELSKKMGSETAFSATECSQAFN